MCKFMFFSRHGQIGQGATVCSLAVCVVHGSMRVQRRGAHLGLASSERAMRLLPLQRSCQRCSELRQLNVMNGMVKPSRAMAGVYQLEMSTMLSVAHRSVLVFIVL